MVDFPASTENGSFCVKPCVDELDDLKRRQNGLPDLLNVVTEEEIARLPREVGTCTVCYIPHVGYLVAMPFKQVVAEEGLNYKNIPYPALPYPTSSCLRTMAQTTGMSAR